MPPRSDKRQDILDAALTVFARDGYTRASIDVIAAEASASTRTIYNHFNDKATLFEQVIRASAERVALRHIAVIDQYLRKARELEDDLTDFGLAFLSEGVDDFASHFALVRHIQADREHIPARALAAWQDTGPLRVRDHLAATLASLTGLTLPDPVLAARQLIGLLSAGDPVEPHIRSAVRLFLHGASSS
jgi:AcrR family transcriptional regulator